MAHVVGNQVSQAYDRSDFFEQRVALMQRWADYIDGLKEDFRKKIGKEKNDEN